MKRAVKVGAVFLALFGLSWFLQGIGLLGGDLTGQVLWAILGLLAIAVGIGTLVYFRRQRQAEPETVLQYTTEPSSE